MKERNYKNRDVIKVSKEGLGDVYEEKLRGFFKCVSSSGRGRGRQFRDYAPAVRTD